MWLICRYRKVAKFPKTPFYRMRVGIPSLPYERVNSFTKNLILQHPPMTIQYVMSSNCHVYGNSVLLSTQFVSCSLSSTNCAPCVGLVITFAGPMSSVARCTIVFLPCLFFLSSKSILLQCVLSFCSCFYPCQ